MINREFDDLYYVEDPDYDDTIISDDPFAEVFGTPDMLRPDKSRRYTEGELNAMSVKERFEERLKCSKDKNALGLIDLFLYDFLHFGIAASGDSIIALSYLYGKTHAEEELLSLMRTSSSILFDADDETRRIGSFMFQIGMKYPYLDDEELEQLEILYNQTKYCALIDDLLFDKDKLPRKIKGITRDDLKKKNDHFPDSLLDMVYQAFEENSEVWEDQEDTVWRVYDRRNNRIISKPYNSVGTGECVASGTIDAHIFFNLVEEKYGNECMMFFVNKMIKRHNYQIEPEKFRTWKHNWVDFRNLSDYAKELWGKQDISIDIKRMIALAFLLQHNS